MKVGLGKYVVENIDTNAKEGSVSVTKQYISPSSVIYTNLLRLIIVEASINTFLGLFLIPSVIIFLY